MIKFKQKEDASLEIKDSEVVVVDMGGILILAGVIAGFFLGYTIAKKK